MRSPSAPPPVPRALMLVVVAALSAPAAVAADEPEEQPPQPPRRDLAALTEHAEQSWPGLRAARRAVDAAEHRLSRAKISPFFQLHAQAEFTVAPEARGTPIYSRDDQLPLDNRWRPIVGVGVEGALPLYTFGKIRAAWDAAEAGIEAAEHDARRTRARLVLDVRRAYFALQLALDTQQMIGEGRGKLEKAIDKLDDKLERGDEDVDRMDRWRLAAARAELEARSSEADRLESTSRDALEVLTGVDEVRIPACPIVPVDFEPKELPHYLALASDNRPEAGMLEAAIDAREADVQRNRGRFFPDLAIAYRATHSYGPGVTDQENPFIQDPANYTSLGAALVARWQLDFWGNHHRVERSEAQLAEVRAHRDEAARGIEVEVTEIYHRVRDARRREQSWAVGERETRQWFVAAAQAYQVGTIEPKELIDAIKTYFQHRFSHLQATRDYNTAVAELQRATGTSLVADDEWQPPCE